MGELTTFARRLKESRERSGLKQKELAEQVNVTPQTISAYEKAEVDGKGKNPTLENAVEIAKVLNVSLDWLCGMECSQSKPDREMTLGDCAKMIADMYFWFSVGFDYIEKTFTILRTGYSDDAELVTRTENCPAIVFKSGDMRKFLEDFRKMRSLLNDKTIDLDLYDRWLQDRITALDQIPCSTQSYSDDDIELLDDGGELLEDDGELPF